MCERERENEKWRNRKGEKKKTIDTQPLHMCEREREKEKWRNRKGEMERRRKLEKEIRREGKKKNYAGERERDRERRKREGDILKRDTKKQS
jgi:hypothetical protein